MTVEADFQTVEKNWTDRQFIGQYCRRRRGTLKSSMDAKPDSGAKELPNGRFGVPATAEPEQYPSTVHPGNVFRVPFSDQDNVAS